MPGFRQTVISPKQTYGFIGNIQQDTAYQDMTYENGKFADNADLTKIKPGAFLTFKTPGFLEVGGTGKYAGFLDYTSKYKDKYENPTTFKNMEVRVARSAGTFTALADAAITGGQRIVVSTSTGAVLGLNDGDAIPPGYIEFKDEFGQRIMVAEEDSEMFDNLNFKPQTLGVKVYVRFLRK